VTHGFLWSSTSFAPPLNNHQLSPLSLVLNNLTSWWLAPLNNH
jgi:hypothetical protein